MRGVCSLEGLSFCLGGRSLECRFSLQNPFQEPFPPLSVEACSPFPGGGVPLTVAWPQWSENSSWLS